MKPVLQAEGLFVCFGGLRALEGFDLALRPGERVALVGDNGAGKSTALDAIGGQVGLRAGRLEIDGQDLTRAPAHRRARAGIARTFQHLGLVPGLTARQNILLAARHRDDALAAEQALARIGPGFTPGARIEQLPLSAQRTVALARALAARPKVLLLDEAFAGLAATDATALLTALEQLAPRAAVLVVEHERRVLEGFVDRTLVLSGGRIVTGETSASPAPPAAQRRAKRAPTAAPRLTLGGFDVPAARLADLHLDARAGEVLSIVGPAGVGKSALAAAIAGELAARGGIDLDGQSIADRSTEKRSKAGLHFAPASGGLLLELTTQDNLQLAASAGADISAAFDVFDALAPRRRARAGVLSGGERRMLALARAFVSGRGVLLLDEPDTGLAAPAAARGHAAARRLADAGAAILRFERTPCPVADRVIDLSAFSRRR